MLCQSRIEIVEQFAVEQLADKTRQTGFGRQPITDPAICHGCLARAKHCAAGRFLPIVPQPGHLRRPLLAVNTNDLGSEGSAFLAGVTAIAAVERLRRNLVAAAQHPVLADATLLSLFGRQSILVNSEKGVAIDLENPRRHVAININAARDQLAFVPLAGESQSNATRIPRMRWRFCARCLAQQNCVAGWITLQTSSSHGKR